MSWKVRHQGLPRSVDNLSLAQVVEGLQDGLWDLSDETIGPQDRHWIAIESHPQLADIALDSVASPRQLHPDETRLDMNPLIDIALVLLIFFILTTSYAALQKVLEMPNYTQRQAGRTPKSINDVMIIVRAHEEDGKPVFEVEKERVDLKSLAATLGKYVSETHKTQLLIDPGRVDWGTIVAIQDAAKGAGIDKAYFAKRTPPTAPK